MQNCNISSNPFGFSYLLDMYSCRPGVLDDLELHYRFLEEIVFRLDMIPMTNPVVVHGPIKMSLEPKAGPGTIKKVEKFPDKAGVSGWIGLITSGIQIHSCEPTHFSTIDVYSCNKFDADVIKEYCQKVFGFEHGEDHWIVRGTRYGNLPKLPPPSLEMGVQLTGEIK